MDIGGKVAEIKQAAAERTSAAGIIAKPSPTTVITPDEMAAGLMAMPSLHETVIDEVDHVIVYGEPGSGKTTLAGLLSEFFNILWFDGDKGLTALKHNLHPYLLKRIIPVRILDNTSTPNFCMTMLHIITGKLKKVCVDHGIVDCMICIPKQRPLMNIQLNKLPKNWIAITDSHTQFYASTLAFAYYKETGKNVGTDTADDYKGNFDYWGIARNIVEKYGNYLKDLPCKYVSISHESLEDMENNFKKLVPVGGSSNANKNYAKYFGSEIHARIVNGKHTFYSSTTANASIQTKSRSNIALELKAVPSLLHIFEPDIADEQLKGSYTEWYFQEGHKPKEKRNPKILMPTPKEVLQYAGETV
jgi:hypothetical protein